MTLIKNLGKNYYDGISSTIWFSNVGKWFLLKGSGKSLVYQLPAVMAENKVTVVVSPLIALIKDQMEHLQKLAIVAESINSKMGEKERRRVIDDLNCKVN